MIPFQSINHNSLAEDNNLFLFDPRVCLLHEFESPTSTVDYSELLDCLNNDGTTEIIQEGGCKRKKTRQRPPSTNHFFSFYSIKTKDYREDPFSKSLGEALKSNTTLTELNLIGEDKRINTHKWHQIAINSFPFSFHINRQQLWIQRCNIIE